MNSFWCSKSMTNILIICWKCIVIKHAKISKLFYSKINSFLFCFLIHFWKYPHARRHMLINYITGPPAFRSFSNPVHLRQLLRPALITKLEHASLGLSKLSVYHKVSVASLKVLVLWAKEEGLTGEWFHSEGWMPCGALCFSLLPTWPKTPLSTSVATP